VPDDALALLRQAAHRTLGSRGLRYRQRPWWDPLPKGITDLNEVVDGEVDLRSGRARLTRRLPAGGACLSLPNALVARIPLVGGRLLQVVEDGDAEDLVLHEVTAELAVPSIFAELPAADAARDEGADERAPRRFDSWTLLELTDVDVPVTVDEPVTAPEPRPGS
jgi:hypothetical protein